MAHSERNGQAYTCTCYTVEMDKYNTIYILTLVHVHVGATIILTFLGQSSTHSERHESPKNGSYQKQRVPCAVHVSRLPGVATNGNDTTKKFQTNDNQQTQHR